MLLPAEGSPLLTRQLLYTAVTRAEQHVRVIGSEAAVRAAVSTPITRASGLRGQLWSSRLSAAHFFVVPACHPDREVQERGVEVAYEDLVRSHVERCLQDIWKVGCVEVDEEGDYPFRTKACRRMGAGRGAAADARAGVRACRLRGEALGGVAAGAQRAERPIADGNGLLGRWHGELFTRRYRSMRSIGRACGWPSTRLRRWLMTSASWWLPSSVAGCRRRRLRGPRVDSQRASAGMLCRKGVTGVSLRGEACG